MSESRLQSACLLILTILAIGAALYFLRPVLVPFVLALFLSLILRTVIDFQVETLRLPHGLALPGALLGGLVLLGLVGLLVSTSVAEVQAKADVYEAKWNRLVENIEQALPLERFHFDPDSLTDPLGDRARGLLEDGMKALLSVLSDGLLVLIFTIFMVTGTGRGASTGMWADIESRVKTYIATKVFVSAVTGIAVGAVLAVLGIDLALVFGLFAFLLNFIPNIGSIIASLLPVPIVVLSDVSTATAILALGIPALIQFMVGNIIEPKIMGSAVDLHPVTILMALIFWGMLWGFVGMLLSVPLTTSLKLIFERIEITRPVARVLAGRPPE